VKRIFRIELFAVGILLLCLTSATNTLAGEISWESSYGRARQRSLQTGRPLVIYVGADFCGYCRKMERGAWTDKSVATLLAARSVPLKVDAKRESALVRQFRVRSLPTVIVVSSSGDVLGRRDGYLDAPAMLAFLRRATIDDQAQAALTR